MQTRREFWTMDKTYVCWGHHWSISILILNISPVNKGCCVPEKEKELKMILCWFLMLVTDLSWLFYGNYRMSPLWLEFKRIHKKAMNMLMMFEVWLVMGSNGWWWYISVFCTLNGIFTSFVVRIIDNWIVKTVPNSNTPGIEKIDSFSLIDGW